MATGFPRQLRIVEPLSPDLQALDVAHGALVAAVHSFHSAEAVDPTTPQAEAARSAVLAAAVDLAKKSTLTAHEGIGWLMARYIDAEASRQITAFHEAGHFVAAYVCDVQVSEIDMRPKPNDPSSSGRIRFRSYDGMHYRWRDRSRLFSAKELANEIAVISLAGYHAQRRMHPEIIPHGCQRDMEEATQLLKLYFPDDSRDQHRERFMTIDRKADDIVCQAWAAISALAQALLETEIGYMSDWRALGIIQAASAQAEPLSHSVP